eukprot:4188922-Alexandrium_andersonii.AAC.1
MPAWGPCVQSCPASVLPWLGGSERRVRCTRTRGRSHAAGYRALAPRAAHLSARARPVSGPLSPGLRCCGAL